MSILLVLRVLLSLIHKILYKIRSLFKTLYVYKWFTSNVFQDFKRKHYYLYYMKNR